MATVERERKSQRMFYALILCLLVGYGVIKYNHIMLAIDSYQGQVLTGDTSDAAK